jgi:hypothetical protein
VSFSALEEEAARRRAAEDVSSIRTRRAALRQDFLEARGWTVVVEAGNPLFPQGFDPWNVERLSAAEVLHTRWIKLGNASGSLEVLDRHCLTEGAGKHPLFEGVARATITGLTSEPRIEETPQSVKISAEGLTLEFRAAHLVRSGQTVTVTLLRSPIARSPDRPMDSVRPRKRLLPVEGAQVLGLYEVEAGVRVPREQRGDLAVRHLTPAAEPPTTCFR